MKIKSGDILILNNGCEITIIKAKGRGILFIGKDPNGVWYGYRRKDGTKEKAVIHSTRNFLDRMGAKPLDNPTL